MSNIITRKNLDEVLEFLNMARQSDVLEYFQFTNNTYIQAGTFGLSLEKVGSKGKIMQKYISNWKQHNDKYIVDVLNNGFWKSVE